MECPSCGAENKPDAVFCMSCGSPLPDVPFSQLKKEDDLGRRKDAAPQGGARAGTPEKTPAPAPTPSAPQDEEPAPAPPPRASTTPETPPAAGSRAVVEEIKAGENPPLAGPSQAAPPRAAAPPPQPPPTGQPPSAPAADTQAAPPIPTPQVEPQPRAAAPPPQPEYYIPPEVDYVKAAPPIEPVEAEPPPEPVSPQQELPVATAGLDSTQEVAAIIAAGAATGAAAGRERKLVCPECYAPNPEGNSFCQECGSPLPLTTGRQTGAAASARDKPAHQKTAVLTPAAQEGTAGGAAAAAQPAYAGQLPRARKAYGDKAFGVADILALFSVGAAAIAVALSYGLDSFSWKKGVSLNMFSHQGAFTQGRTDLLGGPGLLPYEGAEFLTVGLVVAVGVALALIFLALRTGRGPMYILSGCMLLLPVAYLLFQAILPLRQMGIEVDPSVGISGIFFGNAANPGAGPPVWLITGAGALLVLAGFMAPPRGWGRLFTFLLCFSIAVGVAFFCAACFNWNLFISEPAAAGVYTARPLCCALPCSPVPLPLL